MIGAEGERRVNAILARNLDDHVYILLKDVTLPTRHGTAQVDHIVLSRFGIFVRSGSVRLNGFELFSKWISRSVTPPPGLVTTG